MTQGASAHAPGVRDHNRTSMVVLIAAEGISLLGTRISTVALPWLVLITTHNPVRMGVVAGAATVPYILNGFIAAPLVDRVGARRMSILTDVFSAAAMAGVAVGYRGGIVPLSVLVAVNGALRGVGDRAKNVMLKPILDASAGRRAVGAGGTRRWTRRRLAGRPGRLRGGGGLRGRVRRAGAAGAAGRYRAWRHADRTERSAAPAGTGEVVSVTVGYADGEWTVEIDSGRRRLVPRQAIKPAEALDVVDLLDVPGLNEEVEQTVAADQAYARQHAEELRGELDQLETRMAGMSALIELSELRRATD